MKSVERGEKIVGMMKRSVLKRTEIIKSEMIREGTVPCGTSTFHEVRIAAGM